MRPGTPPFGANLRAQRARARLTQEQLAERSGLSRAAITAHERGIRHPQLSTILKLARALGIPPDRLLDGY